jgi:RimJ/RimL family protein N-acetyltransferase
VTVFATKPTLEGALVVLRPFTEADLPAMAEVLADPDVNRLTGSVHTSAEAMSAPTTLDDRTTKWYLTRNEQTDRLDLAIISRETGQCVGEVVFNDLDEENESCNFRILIGPAGRDRGFGSEATRLALEWVFTKVPIHRVELSVFDFNPRAQHVYERAGFVVEGRRRQSFVFDGLRYDDIQMSAIRDEWLEGSHRSVG